MFANALADDSGSSSRPDMRGQADRAFAAHEQESLFVTPFDIHSRHIVMHKLPSRKSLQINRLVRGLVIGVAVVSWASTSGSLAQTQDAASTIDPAIRPEFREPVTLASKDGVLEVRLTARQGEATLDTVATPVQNFLLFDYEVIRGTRVGRQDVGRQSLSGADPAGVSRRDADRPSRRTTSSGLTIRDYFTPQYTPKGEPVPIYPEQMTSSPLNLHVHGRSRQPEGQCRQRPAAHPGRACRTPTPTTFPRTCRRAPTGITAICTGSPRAQVYAGLVGLLAIGRTDGNLPLVTEKRIPVRNMLLQYNFVFDRAGGLAQLNNPNWPQYVSTITPPQGRRAGERHATVRCLRRSTSPSPSRERKYLTVWYAGAALDPQRSRAVPVHPEQPAALHRGRRPRPTRTCRRTRRFPTTSATCSSPSTASSSRVIKSKAGQTEIWVLANVSDFAYINVQLTETATGRHPPIAIVGQDGNPYPAVHYPVTDNGTRLLIPPASRFAIAVTIPAEGELVLEMPPRGGGAKTITAPGVLYTNNGTDNPPAVLGSLSVLPSAVSYADGFFVFPTQVLARAVPSQGRGRDDGLRRGQPLGAYTSFVELSGAMPGRQAGDHDLRRVSQQPCEQRRIRRRSSMRSMAAHFPTCR